MLFFFYHESVSGLVIEEKLHWQQWLEGLYLEQYNKDFLKITRKHVKTLPVFPLDPLMTEGPDSMGSLPILKYCRRAQVLVFHGSFHIGESCYLAHCG